MRKILVILLFFISYFAGAQKNDVNPNGYNKFYYANGQLSSEGTMKDGKPEGYWKTYYPNGVLKSEGNRRAFMLDSVWIFYDEAADTLEKINYYMGKKNGYYYTYEYSLADGKKKGGLVSKELYLEDQKQGTSYYYEKGALSKIISYKNGRKNGFGKELSPDGTIITIYEYNNEFLIYREEINRKDRAGMKQGIWKTFYPEDKIRTEATYYNDSLNGYYKEFSPSGKLIKLLRYQQGVETTKKDSTESKVHVLEEFYPGGKVKFRGGYYDTIPVGLHRNFSADGTVITAKLYDDFGLLEGEGPLDENDQKQGLWKFYFDSGELKAEGKYKNNQRTEAWVYYYKSGKVEQRGSFSKGRVTGSWKWYYESGRLWRDENYEKGKEEGEVAEYAEDSILISKGSYIEGEREGPWYFYVNGEVEEGTYQAGLKEGMWKEYYKNGRLAHEGNFVQGVPDGKHKWYFDNGWLMEEGKYVTGRKEGKWKKFDMLGNIYLIISYKDDLEYKINGKRIDFDK